MSKGTVLVTGSGERLGFEITKALLIEGYRVIAHYRKNRSALLNFLHNNSQYTSNVEWWQAEFPKDLPTAEKLEWENISALIPCVAQFKPGNLFDDECNWFEQFTINAMIPLQLTQYYRKHGTAGSVITVIDGNVSRVNSRFQNYRISKLFLSELTRQMAVTIGENFRVNGIAPGTVLPPEEGADESYRKARELAPTGREVSVDSIIKTVFFLLENRDITGEIISVDGGVHAL